MMITLKKLHFNVILTLFFIIALCIMLFMCEKNLEQYCNTAHKNNVFTQKLRSDQLLMRSDLANQKQLHTYQKTNPTLYDHFFEINNVNSLSALLSTTISNAGFSIQQITPAKSGKDLSFTITTQGNFFVLIQLMNALQKTGWPIEIQTLHINHAIYTINFLLRGFA